MPDRRRTRERQLSKLHARRQAARRRKQRQRAVTVAVSGILVLGLLIGLFVVLANRGGKPSAAATTPPHTTPAPTATTPTAVACGGKVPKAASVEKTEYARAPQMSIDPKKTYTATLVTSCGTIVIRLDPKQSPNAVNSVVFLTGQKFYDGLTFHRIAKDFVVQGGDPKGDGSGGPGYKTVDTPPSDASYPIGTVAMAKGGNEPAGTAGSQFFIVTGSSGATLPPDYAIIGAVISGVDVAKKIEQLPAQGGAPDGPPAETVYIDKLTIKVS